MNTEEKNSAEDTTNETLSSLFHRMVKFMKRGHHHQGHTGHAQMRVLALLHQHEPMNQRDLLDLLNVRSASMSELLGKLEQRNLIARHRDEKDKRNSIITLTKEGTAEAAAVLSAKRQTMDVVFSVLSEDEQEQLAGLLRKVIASLEQRAAQSHPQQGHGGHHMCKHGCRAAHDHDGAGLHSRGKGVHEGIPGGRRNHHDPGFKEMP